MSDPHPLFPLEHDDDEPIEVGWIHVTRYGPTGQQWCPHLFQASELTDLEALHEQFGGGTYELVARGLDRKRVTGRRKFTLAGTSKPLTGEDTSGAPAPHSPAAPAGSSDAILLALMQMMQAQQQNNTQLMIAMLGRSDASGKEHIQSMAALHDRFAQGQGELMRAMLETVRGGGGGGGDAGGLDAFMKGLEFSKEMQESLKEGQDEVGGGGDTDIKDMMEGFKAFVAMNQGDRQVQVEEMRARAEVAKAERARAEAAKARAERPLPNPGANGQGGAA